MFCPTFKTGWFPHIKLQSTVADFNLTLIFQVSNESERLDIPYMQLRRPNERLCYRHWKHFGRCADEKRSFRWTWLATVLDAFTASTSCNLNANGTFAMLTFRFVEFLSLCDQSFMGSTRPAPPGRCQGLALTSQEKCTWSGIKIECGQSVWSSSRLHNLSINMQTWPIIKYEERIKLDRYE